MPFDASVLDLLSSTREVLVETRRRSGHVASTIIWIVVDDGEVFVRSVRGPGARWYSRMVADPEVTIVAGSSRIAARAVPADDDVSRERASRALRAKYSGRSLEAMLMPPTLPTTTRLVPGEG